MAADSPGVLTMVERLRTNRPAGSKPDEAGAAFIYREGIESAMEHEGGGPAADAGFGRTGAQRRAGIGGARTPGIGSHTAGRGRRDGTI